MSSTSADTLERLLLQSRDDLYRLALLLAPSTASAERSLLTAIQNLTRSNAPADEQTLISALVNALPHQQRRWRKAQPPTWLQRIAPHTQQYALLQAISRLDLPLRLALGTTILRGVDAEATAHLSVDNKASVRAQVRDALLLLAPTIDAQITPAALDPEQAPEACKPTRSVLALNDPREYTSSLVRGHLATCADCRAYEQGWLQLTTTVEASLRGALRDQRMPDMFAEQVQAATQSAWQPAPRPLLNSLPARLALVALPVILLIAFMIWPHNGIPTSSNQPGIEQLPAPALHEQIKQAIYALYTPPSGSSTWHARYEIQWRFADQTSALLDADQWIDPRTGRQRLQLVHSAGGGPYEFALADGNNTAWYAISPNYVSSVYPFSAEHTTLRARFSATSEQQQQLVQTQLQSGAWGIAAAYLRQADNADLRSWGRQRDPQGKVLNLIGFSGTSPLALPADAPNAIASHVTILLLIDETSGRLREVREVIGPSGSEQSIRTTWRMRTDEWIDDQSARDRIFNFQQAWNGIGTFESYEQLLNPALPLITKNDIVSLATMVNGALWMPSQAPRGTTSAALISNRPSGSDDSAELGEYTLIYIGDHQRFELHRQPANNPDQVRTINTSEQLTINQQQYTIWPIAPQGYEVQYQVLDQADGLSFNNHIVALGYTKAEITAVLQTLGPPTLTSYLAQAALFADPNAPDSDTFNTLFNALKPIPDDGARHVVSRVFQRHLNQPAELSDPYHLPAYNGWPEQVVYDQWQRLNATNNAIEVASNIQGDDGTAYGKQYVSNDRSWIYTVPTDLLYQPPTQALLKTKQQLTADQFVILRMLACGGYQIQPAHDGSQHVVSSISLVAGNTCLHPEYPQLWNCQQAGRSTCPNSAPYLGDAQNAYFTTVVDLDLKGQVQRIQTWSGWASQGGTLIEAWELFSDTFVPTDRIPVDAFSSQTPVASLTWRNFASNGAVSTIPISLALHSIATPLLGLPSDRALSIPNNTGATEPISATLQQVEKATTLSVSRTPHFGVQSPFDDALIDGYAMRFTYTLQQGNTIRTLAIYQWNANILSHYLRNIAQWSSSTATTVEIAGQASPGWELTEHDGTHWLVFERAGTLIAIRDLGPDLRAITNYLQPLQAQ